MSKTTVFTPPNTAIRRIVMTLEQTGTTDPNIVQILENTLIRDTSTIEPQRSGVGSYGIVFHSLTNIADNNVVATINNKQIATFLTATPNPPNEIIIEQENGAGAHFDGLPATTVLTLEVYNVNNKNY